MSIYLTIPIALAAAALAQPCQPDWLPLGDGISLAKHSIDALAEFDDGTGPALYAGGSFKAADGAPANGLVRWDGAVWSGAQGGIGDDDTRLSDLLAFDDGSGPALYLAGDFHSIGGVAADGTARWNGSKWEEVGGGLVTVPIALAAFDEGDGSGLHVGGLFGGPNGLRTVARLDQGAWADVGTGLWGYWLQFGCEEWPIVRALGSFDIGAGPALYAAGRFEEAGQTPLWGVARWDGLTWSAVGEPIGWGNCAFDTLEVFDDGTGPVLYTSIQGVGLQRWDGHNWSKVPGSPDSIRALAVHDDGGGPALYIAGGFTKGGGIVRWDGEVWKTLGAGLKRDGGKSGATALASVGSGPDAMLVVAGHFTSAGDRPALNIAAWRCPIPCPADCDANGTLDLLDWLCFTALFNAADPAADCDASGSLDLFDFLCFVNSFNAGC